MNTVEHNDMNDDLLVKYLLGEATAAEARQAEEWIAADPAHARQADAFRQLLAASQAQASASDVDTDAAWARFRERTKAQEAPVPVRRLPWMRVAAAMIAAAAIGTVSYLVLGRQTPTEMQVLARHKPLTDTLPDGSVVTLNRAASLSFPEDFEGDTRRVALRGEAFFSVAPNKKKPFVIRVNDVTVTVVGTSFNVRGSGDSTQVIVESGIVQVEHKGKRVLLHPGEQVRVHPRDSTLALQTGTDALHRYFRTGAFECDNTPLWRFVDVLNEAYGSNIVIDRPELRNQPLTTTFKNASLDEVLEVLRITFNLSVSRDRDSIHLR
ncbi:MAG: DUF4974 domain-containing protein [Chitinophagaceae bacterium]|nr:MAG: DUF4974 domain-containing protein [Chitinophagaceae bacterium]